MIPFNLFRPVDKTGISGTGIVAEGVQFTDGKVVMRWLTPHNHNAITIFDSIEDVKAVHCHLGTRVDWLGNDPKEDVR